jgi:hypothetical protein
MISRRCATFRERAEVVHLDEVVANARIAILISKVARLTLTTVVLLRRLY